MATAKRFPNEDAYDAIIAGASARYTVEPELIKAFIAIESNFNPGASRAEAHLKPVNIPGLEKGGDKSYGLMQVLYRTAWALGFRGKPEGLFDPLTSINLGTKYIADLLHAAKIHGWNIDSAISSYNAGPSADRKGDGKRATTAKDGKLAGKLAPFVNQPYVNRVLGYYQHFITRASEARATQRQAPALSAPVVQQGVPHVRTEPAPVYRAPAIRGPATVATVAVGAAVVLLAWLLTR